MHTEWIVLFLSFYYQSVRSNYALGSICPSVHLSVCLSVLSGLQSAAKSNTIQCRIHVQIHNSADVVDRLLIKKSFLTSIHSSKGKRMQIVLQIIITKHFQSVLCTYPSFGELFSYQPQDTSVRVIFQNIIVSALEFCRASNPDREK